MKSTALVMFSVTGLTVLSFSNLSDLDGKFLFIKGKREN